MFYKKNKHLLRQLLGWTAMMLAIPAMVSAQQPEVLITAYGFEDGLTHRNTYKIQQDRQGFLWVATAKGLNRFDGRQFLAWAAGEDAHQLSSAFINDIQADANHQLWLSLGNEIVRLNFNTNTVDSISLAERSAAFQQERRFGSLLADAQGQVWTATYLPGKKTTWLQRTGTDGLVHDIALLPGEEEGRSIVEANGRIYVSAFANEVWVFDYAGKQIEQFEFPAPASDQGFSKVVQLFAGKDQTLWALLLHGQVWHLPPGERNFIRHPLSDLAPEHIHSTAFLVEENGDILLTGVVAAEEGNANSPCSSVQPGAALLRYESSNGALKDYSYFLKQVVQFTVSPRQLFQDRTGVIWMATEFGLVRLVENDLFTKYMAEGNDCCNDGVCSMRGITEDERGNIYFAYYNSIHELNPRSGSLTPLFSAEPKSFGNPFGILAHKGDLWTGSGQRINLKTLEVKTAIPDVGGAEGVLMLDRDGDLWFGCQRDLCILPGADESRLVKFKDPNGLMHDSLYQNISFIYQGLTGDFIWVGTQEAGFFKISKKDGALKHYHAKSQPALPDNRITSLCESGGFLWIGTAQGLGRLRIPDDSYSTFTKTEGLPNDFINAILPEGDSAVWASTDNGLSRFGFATRIFTNFFNTDGLSKNEFNRISAHRASDGRLYFGGLNGVNAFYPTAHLKDHFSKLNSKLMLSGVSWFDGEEDHHQYSGFSEGKPLVLSYRDKMFTVWFALDDFSDPKMHLYSYRLDGNDNSWSAASPANFARFFNIPAGRYTLRVRANRGGGDWVANELAIPITIKQAFYKKGWFQLLMLGVFTILTYAVMQYRLRLAKRHERELEAQVRERTQELESEKEKSEALLLNILPADTAEELKLYGSAKARHHENVTVLFSDFRGFTEIAGKMEPDKLVAEIDYCFRAFDEIMELYGLEKIKTIGDAYMCASGLGGSHTKGSAISVVTAALEMQSFLHAISLERQENEKPYFEARIGIHTGPVIAGIVGIKKFAYDIWGDTVNIASRMQTNGEVGKVNISKSTYDLVENHFTCAYRGKITVKNKGEVDMYFVEGVG